jgi:hypothetical protein
MADHPSAFRQTINQEPEHHGGADREPLTPAERIALTIALINHGLDRMDGFARTTLAGCTQGSRRPHIGALRM